MKFIPQWAYSSDPKIGLSISGLFTGVVLIILTLIPALALLGSLSSISNTELLKIYCANPENLTYITNWCNR